MQRCQRWPPDGTVSTWGQMAAKAERKVTFLRRISAEAEGSKGKEMVGAEEAEPRVTDL